MKSALRGASTSQVEVTNVSKHGVWLWLGSREAFLPFEQFPWFRGAVIEDLLNVEMPHPGHLYWPSLDVDLAVESVDHPERFPLVSQARPGPRTQPTREKRPTKGRRRGARG